MPSVGKDNGNLEHIERLTGKQRAKRSHWLRFVKILDVVVQQVLVRTSVLSL
jgi:hypothetical protein